ncbi:MAG TPA: efflux RND transporter periplasmic adaptor subunit [Candidatus Acidoferrales bacterium]|nr:efflux RND transporter periplasmic adaptor subunit [Candidatus Acidoferrales bacterium]
MPDKKDLLKELRIDRSPEDRKVGSWLWLLLAIPVVLALGGWWWWGSAQAATVRTAAVREGAAAQAAPVLNASGYVTARRRATVSSKITGKVVEVLVEEGMRVREGQLLARLDAATARVNLALDEAQLQAARRALAEIEVRLHEAGLTLMRTRKLVAEGVSSQAALDAAQAERDSLQARLELGREEVAVAERQVGVRQRELDDTIIAAPFDGVVVSKDAQPGEMISPVSAGGGFTRTGICTVVDMSSLEIEVDVNESYIARVEPGQRVEAILDAYPDWRIPARVITPVPTADRQKATVRVRIAFEKLDPRILPDMGVKVTFLGTEEPGESSAQRWLLIPRAAVRRQDGQDVVYVLRQNRVERRAVRLGATAGDDVAVVSGLSAGEQVVVEGPAELANGDRVLVR